MTNGNGIFTAEELEILRNKRRNPYGGVPSQDSYTLKRCINMSKSRTTSGVFRTHTRRTNSSRGWDWAYVTRYGKKVETIHGVSLPALERAVKRKNLHWEILDEEKYKRSRMLDYGEITYDEYKELCRDSD